MVSPCSPWRKLLSLAQRLPLLELPPPAEHLALVERPRRRAAPRAGASRRTGLSPSRRPLAVLGERSKAVSEALRTVARHGGEGLRAAALGGFLAFEARA
jgi:hypothetical protein